MKFIKLSVLVLTILPVATASFALMPLPKEEIDALNKAWRAAPFHVQVEILRTRHPPGLNASRCGEITAIVRRSFKGSERLPLGTSVAFDRCIPVLDLGFTDFDQEFQPGRKLEAVLADDPVSSGKFVIVRDGMMPIREISTKPQLTLGN